MMNLEAPERSGPIHAGRFLTRFLLQGSLNYEVGEDTTGGKKKAEVALSKRYGVIMGYTHIGKRDGIIYGTYALPFIERSNVPLVIPVWFHQYKKFEQYLHFVEWACRGKTYPLVIDDTKKIEEFKDLPRGQGKDAYLGGASEAIKAGGIVATSLVGGRRTSLPEPPVPALSTLLAYLYERDIRKFAVHFVGISPAQTVEPSEYEDLKGWNFKVPLIVRPGNTYVFEELIDKFDFSSKESLKPINAWGYSELAGVVQPSYRGGWPVNMH
jgi:hypothetical protein